jgi:hypothetical protein
LILPCNSSQPSWLLAKTIGLKRQPDSSVRGCGPGPEWLKEFRQAKSVQ